MEISRAEILSSSLPLANWLSSRARTVASFTWIEFSRSIHVVGCFGLIFSVSLESDLVCRDLTQQHNFICTTQLRLSVCNNCGKRVAVIFCFPKKENVGKYFIFFCMWHGSLARLLFRYYSDDTWIGSGWRWLARAGLVISSLETFCSDNLLARTPSLFVKWSKIQIE